MTEASENTKKVRHILSLSGGKDSAALAVYMRDKVKEMEYIFHDTGKELPDTYDYLDRLQDYLGKPIVRTTFGRTFDDLLRRYGGILPSNHRRWCTRMMKLKPFEDYIGNDEAINYVGIRADEPRVGYISHKPNIKAVFPFRDDGIDYERVQKILEDSGMGMPPYTEWGRTRSGCFFCFYQQKIEWVRLKMRYPDLFEEAKAYEKPNRVNGNVFHWSDEPLSELEKPERMQQIIRKWEAQKAKEAESRKNLPLITTLGGLRLKEAESVACNICHR
jgi:3'-phosphoadenosine 5'-phosphosulfate sulfotransferase (PAPS reductase)/FAD synthetase